MENWKDIHPDFDYRGRDWETNYKQEWIDKGFTYQETKEWVNIGLRPTDADYADWLQNIKGAGAEWVLNNNTGNLREEYREHRQIQREKERVRNKSLNFQEWLNKLHPTKEDKEKCKRIVINNQRTQEDLDFFKSINGDKLDLSEYPNLETIVIWGSYLKSPLTQLEIGKKPKITYLDCGVNQLTTLDIKFCPELKILGCPGNQLTNLDVINSPKLNVLNCTYNKLTNLDLSNCKQLEELQCGFNQLTSLNLSNLPELKVLFCNDNHLTEFDYSILNPEKLTSLNIGDNNFPEQDLSVFSKFINLHLLWIGGDNKKHFAQNIYNKFHGSLEGLKDLTKLKSIYISNTDINEGLEHSPNSLERIYCSSKERSESKVKVIEEKLKSDSLFDFKDNDEYYFRSWKDIHEDFGEDSGWEMAETKQKLTWQQLWESWGFTFEEIKQLVSTGLHPSEAYFGRWLANKKVLVLDAEKSRKEHQQPWIDIHEDFKWYQQLWEEQGLTYQDAQEWIKAGFEPSDYEKIKEWKSQNFTPQETKPWLDIGLDKERDAEFAAYLKWKGYQPSKDLNWKQIKTDGLPVQEWLDKKYPTPESKVNCRELNIAKNDQHYEALGIDESLKGSLSLAGFTNLERLDCRGHKITSLYLGDCNKLKVLWCSRNKLSELDLTGLTQLEQLSCGGNYLRELDFSILNPDKLNFLRIENNCLTQNLSTFNHFVNLTTLIIGNGSEDNWTKKSVNKEVQPNIYNRITGSLESLKSMNKLKELDISNTDIDSGLEYLPESIKIFFCSAKEKKMLNAKQYIIYLLMTKEKKHFDQWKKWLLLQKISLKYKPINNEEILTSRKKKLKNEFKLV